MKFICAIFVVFIYLISFSNAIEPCDETPEDPKYNWDAFKKEHNRNYDAEEDTKRHEIFLESVKFIIKQNCDFSKNLSTYTAGLNHFSDRRPHEVPTGLLIKNH